MRARPAVLAAVLAVCAGGWAGAAAAEELQLVLGSWQARALGREARGTLAWVTGPGPELRLEAAAASDEGGEAGDPATLWQRDGRGWTLVCGAPGEPGVLEPWGHPWRPAPAGLADLARAVALGKPGRPVRLVLAAADPADGSDPAAGDEPAAAPAGLRTALARRGRGGGGPGERLAVSHLPGGRVRVTSTRRPGHLEIRALAAQAVAADPAEVYVPWWPLAEVLPGPLPGAPNSGTRGPDGR